MKRYFRVIHVLSNIVTSVAAGTGEEAIRIARERFPHKSNNWRAIDLSASGRIQYLQAQGSVVE